MTGTVLRVWAQFDNCPELVGETGKVLKKLAHKHETCPETGTQAIPIVSVLSRVPDGGDERRTGKTVWSARGEGIEHGPESS